MPSRRTHVHEVDSASPAVARSHSEVAEGTAERCDSARLPLTSESVLERGLWRERAAAQQNRAPLAERVGQRVELRNTGPLEWVPTPSIGQRILRAVSVPAVVGTGVFVVAVVIAIALTMLQFQPARDAQTSETTPHVPSAPASGSAPGLAATPTDTPAGSGVLTVHVVGEVASPGVVEVPAGTRIGEVIAAAGGATDQAVLDVVNLARVVVDGEQIIIPDEETAARAPAPLQAGTGETQGGAGNAVAAAPINLNAADLASLETLPGIGPALAQRIIDWRSTNGAFQSVEQLLEVPGVGEKIFAGIQPQVTL